MPVFNSLTALRPLLSSLSKRRRSQLLILQLLSVLAALGEVANMGALLPFLRILANPNVGLSNLGPLADSLRGLSEQQLLLFFGAAFMVVVVVSTSLRLLAIIGQLRLSALISADLGHKIYANILQRPYSWHLKTNSSSILAFLTRDVDTVFGSLQSLMQLGMNSVIVIFLGGFLVALAPVIMLCVSILLTSFYLIVYLFTRSSLRSDGIRYSREYQNAIQYINEGIGGIRDILIDKTQLFFLRAYNKSNKNQRMAAAGINIKAQAPRYLIEGFVILLIVCISLLLAISGQGIEQQLPLLGTLTLGAYRILQPLQQCFTAVSVLSSNQEASERLRPFLTQEYSITHYHPLPLQYGKIADSSITPLVELDHVSFQYNDKDAYVLNDLNLIISRGERIAFVGTTGSGKSTTSDLILGLLPPTRGRVLVNGLDLYDTEKVLLDWQSQIAHVPQQIYLSDASFASNIAFGVDIKDIDFARVKLASEKANINDLIEASPLGYDTLIGERGILLSGGQRQRLGIARALYKQAKFLVLDEATSALDNTTEAEVMAAIDNLDNDLTVLFIAHRLSTIQNCDKIVLLMKGKIDAIGTFDELIASHKGFKLLAGQRPFIKST